MSTTQLFPDRGGATTQHDATVRRVRHSALVAGIGTLVLAVVAGATNVAVIQGLVTKGDAERTAHDVLASATLFRFGLAALVVAVILDVVIAWALLTFFEPVDQDLSRLAAWFRLSYAAVFAVAISQLLGVLPLLDGANMQALLKIQDFLDIWQVGLVLFGLHLVLIGYLSYRSGYVPRVLGVFLVIAGAGYLVDSFAGIFVADYAVNVAAVTFIGEALLMVWLLVKGRQVTPPEPDRHSPVENERAERG